MKTHLGHLQINVKNPEVSFPFYKDFFKYFEYDFMSEHADYFGVSNGTVDFWIMATEERYKNNLFHRKNTGINHLCFRVGSKEEVDKFCKEFLESRNISPLYETPKLFPEYALDYYAVYFEDPDKIKLEVTYYSE